MADPVLTDEDRRSATWQKIKAYMDKRVELLRAKNDKNLDERKTALLRGSIAELKHLMNLGTERPMVPDEDAFRD